MNAAASVDGARKIASDGELRESQQLALASSSIHPTGGGTPRPARASRACRPGNRNGMPRLRQRWDHSWSSDSRGTPPRSRSVPARPAARTLRRAGYRPRALPIGRAMRDRVTATESAVLEQPPQSGPFEARRTASSVAVILVNARRSLAVRSYRARSPEVSERSAGPPSHPAAGIARPPLTPNWPVPPNNQHDRTHPHRPCPSVRRPARCHRRDVELAENSEDVIDWLLVHQTGSYSAKDAPGRRPARLRARRHWMLRRARPPTRWSTLRGPPRLR